MLLLFGCSVANATHIIGGELFYDHQSGSTYQITLKIYRDCGPTNTNGTGFDALATVGVYDANNMLITTVDMPFPGANTIPVNSLNPCLTPPSVCVEEAVYEGSVSLPPITGGYTLVYQRCCRNPTVLNIFDPQSQGLTCYSTIPDPGHASNNSSPHFVDHPPVALCILDAVALDLSAVDPDGDQLLYELCTPYHGGTPGAPVPLPPAPPPYQLVPWAAGFSVGNMLPSSPLVTIDANTGILNVSPTQLGFYTVGVCVKEYRNGQLLGSTLRDIRFDVVVCQTNIISSIQQQQTTCNGLTFTPINQSNNANSFFWDFGDSSTLSDTSNLASPTYTYSDTGTYVVTLIANPGWPCADTSTQVFEMYFSLNSTFAAPPISCFSAQPIQLVALGNLSPSALATWDLGSGGANGPLNGQIVNAEFTTPGIHTVTLVVDQNGCGSAFTDTVSIYPDPILDLTFVDEGCVPYAVSMQNNSVAWTPMQFLWDMGNGDTISGSVPAYIYDMPGTYPITLTGWTTAGCVDTVVQLANDPILVKPSPSAGFIVDPDRVSILDPIINVKDASTDAVVWHYLLDRSVHFTPDFTHRLSDGGMFQIMQVVTNDVGCMDTAYGAATVHDHLFFAPNAFTPNGDGLNDLFLPEVTIVKEFTLWIYDRYGHVIFETKDQQAGWDGSGAINGVYQYRIILRDEGNFRSHYDGTVTLMR